MCRTDLHWLFIRLVFVARFSNNTILSLLCKVRFNNILMTQRQQTMPEYGALLSIKKKRKKNKNHSRQCKLVQCCRNYNNKVLVSDFVHTPIFVKGFVQQIKALFVNNEISKSKSMVDVVPWQSDVDNLDSNKWPKQKVCFLNPPWSGRNNEKFIKAAANFTECRQGTAIIVTKFECMNALYFTNILVKNDKVHTTIWILRQNFGYNGFKNKKPFGNVPSFGTIVVLVQPPLSTSTAIENCAVYWEDVVDWWKHPKTKWTQTELRRQIKDIEPMYSNYFVKQNQSQNSIF